MVELVIADGALFNFAGTPVVKIRDTLCSWELVFAYGSGQ